MSRIVDYRELNISAQEIARRASYGAEVGQCSQEELEKFVELPHERSSYLKILCVEELRRRAILEEDVSCMYCSAEVGLSRRCYVIPVCYGCLPPPPPLPTIRFDK